MENNKDITNILKDLGNRAIEIGEPNTGAVLIALHTARLSGQENVLAALIGMWAKSQIEKMDEEDKSQDPN